MTIAEVKEILKGRFEREEDRLYWEEKLQELETKERNNAENEKFYNSNKQYDLLDCGKYQYNY